MGLATKIATEKPPSSHRKREMLLLLTINVTARRIFVITAGSISPLITHVFMINFFMIIYDQNNTALEFRAEIQQNIMRY